MKNSVSAGGGLSVLAGGRFVGEGTTRMIRATAARRGSAKSTVITRATFLGKYTHGSRGRQLFLAEWFVYDVTL